MPDAPPTKRPAFQWYPGDAQRDTALRACPLEARGLWREMLDLMHDGEPYGHLTAGGVAIDTATLAGMAGITPRKCAALLHELERRGVFSRTAEGSIYSRRMVKDERIRTIRAKAGRLGGNPDLLKQPDNQTAKQKPTPAVAVATAKPTDAVFEEAWASYPKRPGNSKADAYRQWLARVKRGHDPLDMLAGARRYAKFVEVERTEPRYVKQAQTFFGKGCHFEADWTPAPPSDPLTDRIAQLREEEDAALEKTRQLLAARGAA